MGQLRIEKRLGHLNIEPLARIDGRCAQPHADVSPGKDSWQRDSRALFGGWGRTGLVGVRFNRGRASRKHAHGRSDWTEQPVEDTGQLNRAFRLFHGADAVDGEPIPIRGRRLVAGVEVTNVTEQPGEGDQVVRAATFQRPRGLVSLANSADDLETDRVEPGPAFAEKHQPQGDALRVVGHRADNLVIAPPCIDDRAVLHIVEEAGVATLAVDAQPELGLIAWTGDFRADRGPDPDSAAAIGRRINALHQVTERECRALGALALEQSDSAGLAWGDPRSIAPRSRPRGMAWARTIRPEPGRASPPPDRGWRAFCRARPRRLTRRGWSIALRLWSEREVPERPGVRNPSSPPRSLHS